MYIRKYLIYFVLLFQVYLAVFRPLRVSRSQFRKVLSCMRAIRCLKSQEVYAMEKVTKVDSLSLVLSGKLVMFYCVLVHNMPVLALTVCNV